MADDAACIAQALSRIGVDACAALRGHLSAGSKVTVSPDLMVNTGFSEASK